ncbi:MAG: hypothetical protein NXI23_08070 [Bacteroidetes bacterium]|jgi:hypothetical protein|nr:hypothetical protein [Bacteroidota bacterium]
MKKLKFKEEQRFSRFEIYALLLFFIIGLTYRFVENLLVNGLQMDSTSVSVIGFIVLLAGSLWYLWNLKLEISVNKKGLKYQFGSWNAEPKRIKWEDIEEYRFVESTQPANWSGWNVQFQNEERQVSLCGRNGVQIVTKDGEKLFIGSRKLDVLREKIKNHLAPSE